MNICMRCYGTGEDPYTPPDACIACNGQADEWEPEYCSQCDEPETLCECGMEPDER